MIPTFPEPKNRQRPGRMGYVAWATVLVALHERPMTHQQVASMRGTLGGAQRLREQLWSLERAGLVHVKEWVWPWRSSVALPVFAGGPGESVPYPVPLAKRPIPGKVYADRPLNAEMLAFVVMIRALHEGATRADLREQSGVYEHHIRPFVRHLRALGFLHTADWRKVVDHGGKWAEVMKFGPGADVRKPRPEPRARVARRSRRVMQARRDHLAMVRMTAGPVAQQAAA